VSVTAPRGFTAAGLAAGIKPSGDPDLALVATDDGAAVSAAAVFTSNRMTAAPVTVSRRHLDSSGSRAAAVVLNSGCANAATGQRGDDDAEEMCALTAAALGCRTSEILVCSTGLIGFDLPMDVLRRGIPAVVQARAPGRNAAAAAAEAILTTDTTRKETLVEGSGFQVGGMAKGAAMLAPDMATMLAVLTTDALLEPDAAAEVLRAGVRESFNAVTVDGCTSTNDTVVLLASGRAGHADRRRVEQAVAEACLDLATQMVGDAEGHTKVVRVVVTGAGTDDEARAGARQVAESQLVKCSWYGCDPYWGRVASELGSAGIGFEPDRLTVRYGDLVVAEGGITTPVDEQALAAYMDQERIEVSADLGLGEGRASLLTNDLTHAYIDENMGTS
jgi:glutamate N-acetyltransferase / amino-acid N-acetyltransferase